MFDSALRQIPIEKWRYGGVPKGSTNKPRTGDKAGGLVNPLPGLATAGAPAHPPTSALAPVWLPAYLAGPQAIRLIGRSVSFGHQP